MHKAIQVVLVIAAVCCAVEICALVVSILEPPQLNNEPYLSNMAERAAIRWKVYWFVGAPVATLGVFIQKRLEVLGYTLLIIGTYLMLFGNNGGFWSGGYLIPRLITSFVTLFGLLFLLRNERWGTTTTK